jgi:hypothetical protein
MSMYRYSWLFALVFALALFGFPMSFGIGHLSGLNLRDQNVGFRAVLLSLCVLAVLLRGKSEPAFRGKLVGLFWFFWTLYALKFGQQLLDGQMGYIGNMSELDAFIYWGGVTALPMVFLMFLPSDEVDLNKTVRIAAIVISAGCAFTYYSVSLNLGYSDLGRFRVDQTLNPITFGHLGVSALLLALCGVGLKFQILELALRTVLSGAGVYAIYAASSRGPIVALGVAMLFYLLFSQNLVARVRLLLMLIVAIGFYFWTSVILESKGSVFSTRVIDDFTNDRGRLDLWDTAIQGFLQNPLIGNAVSLPDGSYPHNVVLEAFYVTGVLGGFAFAVVCLACLVKAASFIRVGGAYAFIGLIFIQYFVMNLFSGSLWGSAPFFAVMSAVLVMAIHKRPESKLR